MIPKMGYLMLEIQGYYMECYDVRVGGIDRVFILGAILTIAQRDEGH